jgi:riboflavin kinase/FMN adenylyltransferase
VRVLRQPAELRAGLAPVCAALGFFDGVHRGHQLLLRQMRARAAAAGALAVAVTFDRHPAAVVAPDRVPPLIQTLDQRIEAFAALDLDAVWVIEFTPDFSRMPGAAFVRQLVRSFGRVCSLHVGDRFHFGQGRSGNVALLRALEPELGYSTEALAGVAVDGDIVSSTRIREAIRRGDFGIAGSLLGRPYALRGRVVAGDRLGRTLGFPTANLDWAGLVLPPNGVYAARARSLPPPDEPGPATAGQAPPPSAEAVVNVGDRPSLGLAVPERRVEAHLLDRSVDLYGQAIELTWVARLRGEQQFASLADLQRQIGLDIAAARVQFAARA